MGTIQAMDDFTKYPVIMRSSLTDEQASHLYSQTNQLDDFNAVEVFFIGKNNHEIFTLNMYWAEPDEIVCSTYDEFMGHYSQHRLLKLIGD